MVNSAVQKVEENGLETAIVRRVGQAFGRAGRMMGAGKSSIGRRLAGRLAIPFVDADTEIESAASMTILEIFQKHGEPYFRAGEARVIARLLDSGRAFWRPARRCHGRAHARRIGEKGVSVWLNADIEVLIKRTKRRNDRPLVEKIKELMLLREPFYAMSDIVVHSRDEPHDTIVDEILRALGKRLQIAVGEEKLP